MVNIKTTVRRVLDELPEDCTMQQVLDRLRFVEMIQGRIDTLQEPGTPTTSQEEIERTVAQWLSRSAG